jgi:hypothetical protein
MPAAQQRRRDAGDASDSALSTHRRRLLKAAASAAPVIATLPSGEALAAASALQCIINEQDGTKGPAPGQVPSPSPDGYARLLGDKETYAIENGSGGFLFADVYHVQLPASGEEIRVWGDNAVAGVPEPGTWFSPGEFGQPDFFLGISDPVATNPWEFLYLYKADSSPLDSKEDIAVNPDGTPADCDIAPSLEGVWDSQGGPPGAPTAPGSPPGKYCFHPLAVQETAPQTPGNVPLTNSCLVSFHNASPGGP